jgi:hypothetical protein
MIAKKIYESPDIIALPDLKYNEYGESLRDEEYPWAPEFGDYDSHPFWLDDGELKLGKAISAHPVQMIRDGETLPGRIWKDRKMVSFWVYPERDRFFQIMDGLSALLSRYYNEDINILKDPEWKVEILPTDQPNWRPDMYVKEKNPKLFNSELISVNDYMGSGQRSEEELGKEHEKSPMKKKKREIFGGSKKYGTQKPLPYRQKLVPESLNEMRFERGGDVKQRMGIGKEAVKEKVKKDIQKDIHWHYDRGDLGFSEWDLDELWKTYTPLEKMAVKDLMEEFLSGKKKWRIGYHHLDPILAELGLAFDPKYKWMNPSNMGLIYGKYKDEALEYIENHWTPNQMYGGGIKEENYQIMKMGIDHGATNVSIGDQLPYVMAVQNEDYDFLKFLLDNNETEPQRSWIERGINIMGTEK